MGETENRGCYTICVFQDTVWAGRGLEALRQKGFENGVISILSKQSSQSMELFQELIGFSPSSVEVNGLGNVVAHGRLIEELTGSDDGLGRTGVAATIRRVGFLPHDGFIFQTLTERGGVLVAVESESRAADALALFHSYGGGNAAIGAWSGRV